jgi:MOSC domain-containing protein YiiM
MASTPVSAAVTFGRDVLADQLDLLAGVKSGELKLIAGDLILQLGQQRQPCRREVAALVINDPQHSAQLPFAHRYRGRHADHPFS